MPNYDGEEPTKPRRPKPSRPDDHDHDDDLQPSTFRPSPAPKPERAPISPRKAKARKGAAKTPAPVTTKPSLVERVLFGSVSLGHLSAFCRQAAVYLDAGVDLFKALGSLQRQFATTALGPVLTRVQSAIKSGSSLAEAMSREPQAFDSFFLSMIKAAEARGAVPEVLRSMSEHYESRQRLLRQARSALIYPPAVILIGLGVGWLLTTVVLPKVLATFADLGGSNLPAPTRALLAISAFMKWIGWWALPLAAVAGAFLLFRFYKTAPGKATLDRIALNIPVLGPLLRKLDTARMARTLASLLGAGVDFSESMSLTAGVMRMTPMRQALQNARQQVLQGTPLSDSLRSCRQFDPDVFAFLETGESTGQLPECLDKLADDYEEQVELMVKNLGQLVQPVIYVILGGMVLFILLAFFMAYAQVISNLAGAGS